TYWSVARSAPTANEKKSVKYEVLIKLSYRRQRLNHLGWLFAFLCSVSTGPGVLGDKAANLRVFRSSDGLKDSLATAISLSPRGTLWIKHGDANEISKFDGYSVHTMPSPGKNNFRVYESRSGQLWSLYKEGIVVYEGSQWVEHPIPEIRAEIEADPLRQIRQISLVPAERDRVFFLISDKLMEYDAASMRRTLV